MRIKEIIKKFIPSFLLNLYHFLLALLGAFFYGFPGKKLTVIGITGTSGKSTVVSFTTRILEEAGYKVASLSSIKFKIGEKETENMLKMTMPGRFKLHKFLKKAVKSECDYAVLEVTSEGIKQHRHEFIDFDVVLLTNLSPEHIEAHGGFENYRRAKGKLFEITKKNHIVNLDDKNTDYFLKFPSQRKYGFGIEQKSKEFESKERKNKVDNFIEATDIELSERGIVFKINKTTFSLELFGKFNIYNALSAISVGISQGIKFETCKKALEKIKKIPGRMEIVVKKPFFVIVDYAHTPKALRSVYNAIYNSKIKKKDTKMICVLGACGGGRDKWKRPVLGKIASKYCQRVIITNEDPYEEPPIKIIEEVIEGTGEKAEKILDRKKAIKKAIKAAKEGDVVVITGKGSEPWMCVKGGKKISWDDRKIAREEFKKVKL